MSERKFEARRVVFKPDPMNEAGGLVELGPDEQSSYDAIGLYLIDWNGISTHLFDLSPHRKSLAEFIVEAMNSYEDFPEDKLRTCCGFMDPVGFEHNGNQHRDIFECPRCNRKESGSEDDSNGWVKCDCPKDKPEYEPEDDRRNFDQ